MKRSGLGKGLGTLLEPREPSPGNLEPSTGAVRLFLKNSPTPNTSGPQGSQSQSEPQEPPALHIGQEKPGVDGIPILLWTVDALLIGAAAVLLRNSVQNQTTGLVLGTVLISLGAVVGVVALVIRDRNRSC